MSEKHKGLHFAGKLVKTAAGFALINFAGVGVRYHLNEKKMQERSNENNLCHSQAIGNSSVDIKADTQNAYITNLTGVMKLNFNEGLEHENVYLDLCSVLGRTIIYVPENVAVDIQGEGHLENIKDMRNNIDADTTATLHIIRKNVLAELVIQDAE